jgi:hypothetical protein
MWRSRASAPQQKSASKYFTLQSLSVQECLLYRASACKYITLQSLCTLTFENFGLQVGDERAHGTYVSFEELLDAHATHTHTSLDAHATHTHTFPSQARQRVRARGEGGGEGGATASAMSGAEQVRAMTRAKVRFSDNVVVTYASDLDERDDSARPIGNACRHIGNGESG